jgi:DinB superfamily
MAKSIYQSEITLNMNTKLFHNALAGVTEEQAKEKISYRNNSLDWLTTHTVWARYNMAKILGNPPDKNPYDGLFDSSNPLDTSHKFQTLDEIKAEWDKATVLLQDALASVKEEHLAGDAPFKSPIGDRTIGGVIAFLVQHESYNIGQIAFLKKYFTNEAMKY